MEQKIEIITLQQRTAWVEYQEFEKKMEDIDLPVPHFWDWYWDWCFEKGLFNDRASFQN